MNEGMNNNNYNSTPNYNYEKKNNGVKALLIVLIILVLCLIGLLSYKIFIVDKNNDNKENNKVNNNVVEKADNNANNSTSDNNSNNVNDKEEKMENVAVTNVEVKKYYDYVSAKHIVVQNSYDFNYFNNNKNEVALERIIGDKHKIIKKCSDYDVMENTNNPNFVYTCYTEEQWDQGCVSSFNKEENAKVNVLDGKYLKEAVEEIYGKNSYVAKTFTAGNTYQYINSKDEYIELTTCGGGLNAFYNAELYSAEKNSNTMILYEKITGSTLDDVKVEKINIKHVFEKNSYDNNYHYVKSEKA